MTGGAVEMIGVRKLSEVRPGLEPGEGSLAFEPHWRTLVEIGTSRAVTALQLGLAMRCRGGAVVTFDRVDVRHHAVKRAWLDNMRFVIEDVLPAGGGCAPGVFAALQGARDPLLLMCDGGDKPEEVRRYAPLLRPGDGLVVHDWREPRTRDGEISWEQSPPFLRQPPWRRLDWAVAEMLGSGFRAWARDAERLQVVQWVVGK